MILPEFHGFREIIVGLRSGLARREAASVALRLAVGALAVGGFVVAAARRRDFALLAAIGAVLVLPLVRHQQYGYVKYYILLPVIVAVAASRLPARVMVPLAVAIAVLNGSALFDKIRAGRQLYAARVRVYEHAGPSDCWLSTGWGPPIGFRWPGTVCAVLGKLAGGSANDVNQVISQAHANLTACLRQCFCEARSVYTDDMTERGLVSLGEVTRQFQYSDLNLADFVLAASRAELVSQTGDEGDPVYEYGPYDRRRLCDESSAKPVK